MRKKLKNITKSDIIKNIIEFKTYNKKIKAKNQRYKNMKNQNIQRRKHSFQKKKKKNVENAVLYKPILKKIMTTREYYIKCKFCSSFKCYISWMITLNYHIGP